MTWAPPFKVTACFSKSHIREEHMLAAVRERLPHLADTPPHDGVLTVAGYGPSLADTWQEIRGPLITTSGAHNYLIERGIVPYWHVDMDPRKSKLAAIMKPHPEVTYLMASVCHPFTWALLKGHKVYVWHVLFNDETPAWVARHDPTGMMLSPGSAVGLAAIAIGRCLGFRKFECHGMDCSKRNGWRHAGPHYGVKLGHEDVRWRADGRTFISDEIMFNTAAEFMHWVETEGFGEVRLHGDGLTQAMVREAKLAHARVAA